MKRLTKRTEDGVIYPAAMDDFDYEEKELPIVIQHKRANYQVCKRLAEYEDKEEAAEEAKVKGTSLMTIKVDTINMVPVFNLVKSIEEIIAKKDQGISYRISHYALLAAYTRFKSEVVSMQTKHKRYEPGSPAEFKGGGTI